MNSALIFILSWSMKTALVVVVALCCCLLGRHLSSTKRNVIWRCALAVSLLIPFGMLLAPHLPIGMRTQPQSAVSLLIPETRSIHLPFIHNPLPYWRGSVRIVAKDEPTNWAGTAAYLAGLLLVVGNWGTSLNRVRRFRRLGARIESHGDCFVTSDQSLTVPITFGWLRPVIVLPAESTHWSEERLSAVILHEGAHMKRKDWLWQSISVAIVGLQWFNPMTWILSAFLRSTAEESADDMVLESGVTPSSYASELLYFVSRTSGSLAGVTPIARPGGIASRLRRILATNRDRRQPGRRLTLCISFLFAAAGLALATLRPETPIAYDPLGTFLASWASSLDPAPPGFVKLPNGADARVVYVGNASYSKLPVWQADGSPAKPVEDGVLYDNRGYVPPKGMRQVAVCFEITGLKFPDMLATMAKGLYMGPFSEIFPCVTKLGGDVVVKGSTNETKDRYVSTRNFLVPVSLRAAALEIGVGVGDYKAVQGKSIVKRISAGPQALTSENLDGHPHSYKTTTSRIDVILPNGFGGKDWRLVAYDAKGQILHRVDVDEFPPFGVQKSNPNIRTCSCFDPPEKIARVELEARDYKWVKIPDVQLYPARKSNEK